MYARMPRARSTLGSWPDTKRTLTFGTTRLTRPKGWHRRYLGGGQVLDEDTRYPK